MLKRKKTKKMNNNKILISVDEVSFNIELSKQNSIAKEYSSLEKLLPYYCKQPFSNYVTDSDNFTKDFKKHCENIISLEIPIAKKLDLVNENWFLYRDKLTTLNQQMNESLLFSNEIENGQLTTIAKDKLIERFSTYAEGSNIEVYEKALECENALNELNELLKANNKTPLINFSQLNYRYFKRSNDVVKMDIINILF
jgi:hypothetical protein